jgi:hypothetical protein
LWIAQKSPARRKDFEPNINNIKSKSNAREMTEKNLV